MSIEAEQVQEALVGLYRMMERGTQYSYPLAGS